MNYSQKHMLMEPQSLFQHFSNGRSLRHSVRHQRHVPHEAPPRRTNAFVQRQLTAWLYKAPVRFIQREIPTGLPDVIVSYNGARGGAYKLVENWECQLHSFSLHLQASVELQIHTALQFTLQVSSQSQLVSLAISSYPTCTRSTLTGPER